VDEENPNYLLLDVFVEQLPSLFTVRDKSIDVSP